MRCYYPLDGWRSRSGGWTANRAEAYVDLPMSVACGQCIGCRLKRSADWAVRCMHEAQLHDENAYLTLTYAVEPADGSLRPKDFTDFMKRLRKHLRGRRISYFQCGEYGEKLGRPHHHAAIFGYSFPDKKRWKKHGGHWLYVSQELDRLWGHGYCTIGEVTFDSAAYIARYCTKKIYGPGAKWHYTKVDAETGELYGIAEEYVTMSRRPAIGKRWLEKFNTDVYPSDEVIVRGHERKPPRYYDKQHEKLDAAAHLRVQRKRLTQGNTREQKNERTPERLAVQREVLQAQVSTTQKRRFEQ